jgi:hypothetical protein
LWVSRNDNEEAQQRVRIELGSGAPFEQLQQTDAATAGIYQTLLNRAIDRSRHPNTYANVGRQASGGAVGAELTREYFVCDDDVQRSCLRSAAQVGICCLSIFFYVFQERYRELGLDVSINKLRQGH